MAQATQQCVPGWCGSGTPSAFTRSYTYDWANNPTGESYGTVAAGTLASLGYGTNLAGQITSVSGGQDSSVSTSLYSAPTQTPFGPSAATLGNGVAATLNYDTFGRPNGLGLTLGSSPLYAYTTTWLGKRVASASDSVNGSGTYGYDSLNRLSTASITTTAGTLNLSWGYDRYGNRLSQSATGSYTGSVNQPSFTVDATTNRLTSSGYTYDAAGNLMTDGVNTYTYDAEGNLIGVTGGTSATFTYDALNQRVLTVINGTTRAYGFNLAGQRATVWDGSGNLISAQYYAGSQPLAYYLASDGHVRFQHQDWLGTERFRTTYTGTVAGSFTSLPFGDSTSTASGTDTDAYHYAGLDADTTDLQHATFRQYSAIQGRWLRPDPYDGSYRIADPQSFNRYAYVSSSPAVSVDPSGLASPTPPPNLPPLVYLGQMTNPDGGMWSNGMTCLGYTTIYSTEAAGNGYDSGDVYDSEEFTPDWCDANPSTPISLAPPQAPNKPQNNKGFCGGTFYFSGLEGDGAVGGAMGGVITEQDSQEGTSAGVVGEGWLGGEGLAVGAGATKSLAGANTKQSLFQGMFLFIGGSISAGPFAGFQTGFIGGNAWAGGYFEGHLGPWAFGHGAYVRNNCKVGG